MRYRIKDLAPGLDGLIVEGELDSENDCLVVVTKISNESIIIGDRSAATPVTDNGLFLSTDFLEPVSEAKREYAHNNPFGKVLFEGRCERGSLQVVYTQYENALSVNVREILEKRDSARSMAVVRTLYAQNFFGSAAVFSGIKQSIEDSLSSEEGAEELIFVLRDIKEMED